MMGMPESTVALATLYGPIQETTLPAVLRDSTHLCLKPACERRHFVKSELFDVRHEFHVCLVCDPRGFIPLHCKWVAT